MAKRYKKSKKSIQSKLPKSNKNRTYKGGVRRAKRISETQAQKRQSKLSAKEKAQEINDIFKNKELPRSHKWKYNPFLAELVQGMLPSDQSIFDIEAGDKTSFFKVDNKYDGDIQKLFEHIKFTKIPATADEKLLAKITQAPQDYEEKMLQAQNQAFQTNLKNLKMNNQVFMTLEYIMNTSAAWNVASQTALDSDQVQKNWQELYTAVQRAKDTGDGQFLDEIVRDIENEADFDSIIAKVDSYLVGLMKGE